jgi:hypothetical protein
MNSFSLSPLRNDLEREGATGNRAGRSALLPDWAKSEDSTGDSTVSLKRHCLLVLNRSPMRDPDEPLVVNGPGRSRTCDLGIKSPARQAATK